MSCEADFAGCGGQPSRQRTHTRCREPADVLSRQGPARERRDGGERGRPATLVRPIGDDRFRKKVSKLYAHWCFERRERATIRWMVIADASESDGLKAIDLGAGHSSSESLCGRVISTQVERPAQRVRGRRLPRTQLAAGSEGGRRVAAGQPAVTSRPRSGTGSAHDSCRSSAPAATSRCASRSS